MANKNIIPKPCASSNNFLQFIHRSVVNFCRKMPFKNSFNRFPIPEKTFAPRKVLLQAFSFPNPIMNYIKKNPSTPKIYINLLKSCKYFYSKKDLVIPLRWYDRYQLWEIIIKSTIKSKKEPSTYKLPFNIWFTVTMKLDRIYPYYNNNLNCDCYFYKFATKFTLKVITIHHQSISWEELKLFTNNGVKNVDFRFTTIYYSNGTVVPVEEIFVVFKKIEFIFFKFSEETAKLVTTETAKNLAENIDTSELAKFFLVEVPKVFDFGAFQKFTDAHQNVDFKVDDISSNMTYSFFLL